MIETIHIYHTNDIHSHFENWPRIRDFLLHQKKINEENGEEVFLFDIGDHVDRWHPLTESTVGKQNIQLLNEVGYTAVTIGNNEGITLPYNDLDTLYTEAEFDVILANLYNQQNERPSWTIPYQIYQTEKGIKVGITGVTANFKKLYSILGWDLKDPIEEIQRQVERLKKESDIIILLSHLGIHDDEKIAKLYPEIDIILGGHTHHILENGRLITNALGTTLLGAAGKHGKFVGHVQLKIDVEKKEIKNKKAQLYKIENLPAPINETIEIEKFYEDGRKLLFQEVVTIPEPLSVEWFQDSILPHILCEAIQEWCSADCAMINAGLLLDHLEKGIVTKYEIHKILPHPINPCMIKLSGAELKSVLQQSFDPKWPPLELKGLGFRGTILGNFVYNNISIRENDLYINGMILKEDKMYTLGTVDMYTFGHFFPEFNSAEKQYFMPEFIRDVMEWKLKKLYSN